MKNILRRYLSPHNGYSNIAELEFYNGTTRLTGTGFGTAAGPYDGGIYTFGKALDGNTSTFFDSSPSGGYVGIDTGATINTFKVRFFPRVGFADRMLNGVFQGSNTSSTSGYTDLGTISTQPTDGAWTELNLGNTSYRYLRYLSPSYGNVAELEFYNGTTRLSGTGFGTAGSWGNSGATFDKALDNNTSTLFDAPAASGAYVGIDRGSVNNS